MIPRKTLTYYRYGTGSFVNGVWTEATETSGTFTASVQPPTGKDLETLPEGRRNSESYVLYTDTELLSVSNSPTRNPDSVAIDGRRFEVYSVRPWQNTIIDHYQVLVIAK